MVPVWKFL